MFFHTMKISMRKITRLGMLRQKLAYHSLAILVLATFILK